MTNQNNELNEILAKAMAHYKAEDWNGSRILTEAKQAIQALIRTEKLKLLDEVRERVIGEDEPGVTNIMIAAEHAEQRNVLTKLEAEL